MLGFNGGLLGKKRKQEAATPGLWFPNERAVIVGSDPYWDNVSLLLHMDGSNGSTTFTDSSSNAFAVTANGSAEISTAQSKFGGASALFNTTASKLSISDATALDLGAEAFTIEGWIRLATYPTLTGGIYGAAILSKDNILSDRSYGLFIIGSSGSWTGATVTFDAFDSGENYYNVATTYTFALDTWYHIAVVRSANTVYLFLDGSLLTSGSFSITVADKSNALTIGGRVTSYEAPFPGHIDDFRITKGIARYTANFTPPTAPFPNG